MDERPEFDRELANRLVGKHVLIGLTYLHHDGTLDRHAQVHGFVARADETTVAVEVWGTGEMLTLPPDLRPFHDAPPGEYRLRSTGEVVVDPDYLASWTITAPAPDDER